MDTVPRGGVVGAQPSTLRSFAYPLTPPDNRDLVTETLVLSGGDTLVRKVDYRYDDRDRLKQELVIEKLESGSEHLVRIVDYTYDSVGNRDPAQVIEERDAATGVLRVRYTHGLDLISQTRHVGETSTTSYYHHDGQLSVRQLTDKPAQPADVDVSDSYSYGAFGEKLSADDATPNSYRYTGEQFEADTGLYYLRAGYYQPSVGRFVGRDSFPGNPYSPVSLHRYMYGNANPLSFVDPDGEQSLAAQIPIQGIMLGIAAILVAAVAVHQISKGLVELLVDQKELISDFAKSVKDLLMRSFSDGRRFINTAWKAIRAAARELGRTVKELKRLPRFYVVKSAGKEIYNFTTLQLLKNPRWFVLTYLGSSAQAKRTRDRNRAWVRSRYEHLRSRYPANYSFDEFPYASTFEGGFPNAVGHFVPEGQNWLQGAYLTGFYLRKLKGKPGPYLVVPVPV